MGTDTRKGLTAATLVLMGSTLASRVLGLLRETLLAARLGTGSEADAYATAFLLPDLVNTLLAGGFLSLSFVPLYLESLRNEGREKAARFLGGVALLLAVGGIVAIAVLAVFARPALELLQPGLSGTASMERAVHLTRILLPAQLCFLLAGAWNGAQYAHRRFLFPALAPLVYNVGIIAGGWFLAPWMGAEGFAWGVLAGALAGHLFLQGLGLRLAGAGMARPVGVASEMRAFLWKSLPLMLGLTLGFSADFLLRRESAYLGTGGVAQAGYAYRLMLVLVALFGQSTGVASYPYMVELVGKGEWETLQELVGRSLRQLAAFLVPVSFFTAAYSDDLVRWAFRRGRFGEEAVGTVGHHLALMVWCVFPWCVQIVLARALYARGRFWLGAALGTACVVVSWPVWAWSVDRLGAPGVGAGLVLLVVLQAVVFSIAWIRGPSGMRAFRGMAALLLEIVAVSAACSVLSRACGGGLRTPGGAAVVLLSSTALLGWALVRGWPGFERIKARIRARFPAQ
jgi:putative peptidoglycan lipid II flippase